MTRVRRTAVAGALALTTGLAVASPAAAARVVVGSPTVAGAEVFVVGLGFAPPNEFCTTARVRVDGAPATVRSKRSDDVGTWVFRISTAGLAAGLHVARVTQTCENAETGERGPVSAQARFRIV